MKAHRLTLLAVLLAGCTVQVINPTASTGARVSTAEAISDSTGDAAPKATPTPRVVIVERTPSPSPKPTAPTTSEPIESRANPPAESIGEHTTMTGGVTATAAPTPSPAPTDRPGTRTFVLTLSNISDSVSGPIQTSNSRTFNGPLTIGVGMLMTHSAPNPFFSDGFTDAHLGLEELAEASDPTKLIASMSGGAHNSLAVRLSDGLIVPGAPARIIFKAGPGDRVSFAACVMQSNDYFFATKPEGVDLFQPGTTVPVTGDITADVSLWDAGTELDRPLGSGDDQVFSQISPVSGGFQGAPVQRVPSSAGIVPTAKLIKATISLASGQ